VPPGRWTIEGEGRESTGRQTVDVETKPLRVPELVLSPKPASHLIVTTSEDPDAPPIDGVVVTNAGGVVRMSRSAAPATFSDLPPGTYKIFGLDRRGGVISGPVVGMGTTSTSTTLAPRVTRNVRIHCRNAQPGDRVVLLGDGYSVGAVLAYNGVALSVLDDGTIAIPPLSDGRWTIRVGNRAHEIEVSRDEVFDLDA
jgi:hypothetical protein